MQKNDDRKNKSFIISEIRGLIAGFVVILIVFALAAALISSGRIPEGAMKIVVWTGAFLGAFLGAVIAIKSHRTRALITGGTVGAALFVMTIIGAAFSKDGALAGPVTPGIIAALLAGCLLGSLLCVRKKGRKRG